MANVHDYVGAGFRVFGLHKIVNGKCTCDLGEECKAAGKHPMVSSWQFTPDWSDEQIEVMEMTGQFATGFGVICKGWLIIDVDPRNGGDVSFARLQDDLGLDLFNESGFVVNTGGGGQHVYFKYTDKQPLKYVDRNYAGIEFKTTGYVVGCDSMHATGMQYESRSGHPDDVAEAPQSLLDLLKRMPAPEFSSAGDTVTSEEVRVLLDNIPNDGLEYDEWLSVGMAIHHALDGDGYSLWDYWSRKSDKHDAGQMDYKWHSFGKRQQDAITIGTLRHMAAEAGYSEPVTFEHNLSQDSPQQDEHGEPVDVSLIDLFDAPGLVGQFIAFINSQSRYPRRHLAVAAALSAMGNIGGIRHEDEEYGATANIFAFCVAGSSTGKEAVQQAQRELQCAAGLAPAIYGSIKSEQEVYRNAIDHQINSYIIDEFGLFLAKIENARKKGSASYLENVIGAVMSIYSKADGRLILGGDQFKEIMDGLKKDKAFLQKNIDQGVDVEINKQRLEEAGAMMLDMMSGGLYRPFMGIIGYTTPVTFNSLVNYEIATNGFIGRSIIFEEKETNPRATPNFKKGSISDQLRKDILYLSTGQKMDVMVPKDSRIEYRDKLVYVETTDEAKILLDSIYNYLHDYAEYHKETTGLESVVRRAFEHTLKVSMVLAIGDGLVRTVEHVQWAYALIKRDIDNKMNLTTGNMAEEEKNRTGEVISKVTHCLDKSDGASIGFIANRLRSIKKEDIEKCLDYLVNKGIVRLVEVKPARGPTTVKYYAV